MASGQADATFVEPAPHPEQVRARSRAAIRLGTGLRLLAYLLPFVTTGIVYELLRGIFHHRGEVHVGDLYALEGRLFSVATAAGPRSLSDVISQQTNVWLDVACGVTYLLFLVEVVGVTVYLFFRARRRALEVSLGFLCVNLLGWGVWLWYPAAPPWYVDLFGVGATGLEVVSSPAGLQRLDALLGLPVATTFYAKSANVFGAVPSLHVAYATLVACVAAPLGGWLRWAALGFAGSMAFSAVYLRHHYVLDVVAGIALAVLVAVAMRAIRQLGTAASGPASGVLGDGG